MVASQDMNFPEGVVGWLGEIENTAQLSPSKVVAVALPELNNI